MGRPGVRRVLNWTLAAALIGLGCGQRAAKEDLGIYEKNPFYFTYRGKPVLLLGGSDEDNLFNHPDLLVANLDALQRVGGDYIRCTMSSRDSGNVWPFAKLPDGRYDLDRFNPEYWARFERCLSEAERRGIIVQMEVWATFDFYRDNWLRNPFNPSNNVNYDTTDTQLEPEWPFHPAFKRQPFFYSVPGVNGDSLLLRYQRRFVDRLLSISLRYGNVLYCLDNETRAPAEWAWYWARYIREKAREKGRRVYITEMWDPHDIRHEEHARTYARPDLFDFFDISQNNWQEGDVHYQRILWARSAVTEHGGARPLTNVKVYHRLHGGRPNDPAVGLDRWWQNIFAGCASTRFHRPPSGIGLNEMAQKAIRAARVFTSSFDIFACAPALEVLREREVGEAYCLAEPGHTYALYFPTGGEVKLRVEPSGAEWQVRWFDTEAARFLEAATVKADTLLSLTSPDTLRTWLVLVSR